MAKAQCEYCQVSYDSVSAMCDHVMEQKHREVLESVLPDDVKELGQLQYFVDTHLRRFCILGLQYIMEIEKDVYFCRLCKLRHNWREMAIHISNLEHMERYVHTHHNEEVRHVRYAPLNKQAFLLRLVAQRIFDRYGSGKIYSKKPRKVWEGGCSLCNIHCATLANLSGHYVSESHKNNLLSHAPEQLEELGSLVHFMKHHMEKEFPLGLEYIVEIKEGSSYNFTCQLCGFNANLCAIVNHIMEVDHMQRYVRTHHRDMLSILPKCTWSEYCDVLRDIAAKIVLQYGRKEIQLKNCAVIEPEPTTAEPFLKGDNKTSKACEDNECDALSAKHKSGNSSHSKRRPLPYPEAGSDESHESYSSTVIQKKSNIDGLPLAKRGRHFAQGNQDASPSEPHTSKYWSSDYNERETQNNAMELEYSAMKELDLTAVQDLEFKTNDQFFEYLANFSIDDDKDIHFIQKITKNCIEALTNFKEEAKKQNSSFPT